MHFIQLKLKEIEKNGKILKMELMCYLNNEHGNWGYLHVMTKLEIIEK